MNNLVRFTLSRSCKTYITCARIIYIPDMTSYFVSPEYFPHLHQIYVQFGNLQQRQVGIDATTRTKFQSSWLLTLTCWRIVWRWLGTFTHMHLCNGLGNTSLTQVCAPICHNTPHYTTPQFPTPLFMIWIHTLLSDHAKWCY